MPRAVLVRDPSYPIGGFETWVELLAGELPKRGIEVITLVPRSADPASEVLEALAGRAAAGECGVFFSGGYEYLNVAGLNLPGSPWTPVAVLHGHDPGAVEWFAVGPPARIVVPATDLARALEGPLRARIGRLRMWRRLMVIPHGVPIPPLSERPLTPPYRVVIVSRFEHGVKRPSDYAAIVKAAAHLPLHFTFIGSGSALPELQRELEGRAEFTGSLPRQEVYERLRTGDVFLSASSSEAFGLAVAEALAAGCHVIAADAGAAVRDMLAGRVVRAGDIDAFVRELEAFVARPRRDEAGRERIARHYSLDAMADSYAHLVRELRPRPDRSWRPPGWRTPAEALPRTIPARAANWIRSMREVLP
jgi:glycosyltransferase involved in cell wall biosynthesis